jgi:Transcriptional regulatory protein, C terminal
LGAGEPVDSQMDVRLLGHLEVEVSGERVRFEGVKQRRLFAMLALGAPEAVSADELVEALWGSEPPAGAAPALQKQISRLRRRLGDGGSLVRHRPPGYALDIDPRAEQGLAADQLVAQHTCVFVDEPGLGERDRHMAGERLEQACLAPDDAAVADPQHEIARGVDRVVEAAAELDDLGVEELRRVRSNGSHRTVARCACHSGLPR